MAFQCALHADPNGEVCLLRGMRLHQRADLWDELEYAGWLRRGARSRVQVRAHLLDAAMQASLGARSAPDPPTGRYSRFPMAPYELGGRGPVGVVSPVSNQRAPDD